MRPRKNFEVHISKDNTDGVIIELLLDIRELLTNYSEYIKRLNLATVKIISHGQVEEEMAKEMLGGING